MFGLWKTGKRCQLSVCDVCNLHLDDRGSRYAETKQSFIDQINDGAVVYTDD